MIWYLYIFNMHSQHLSHMQCSIVNCSHHAVHYIPITYLFCNWVFFPTDLLHPFHPHTFGNHQCVLCIYDELWILNQRTWIRILTWLLTVVFTYPVFEHSEALVILNAINPLPRVVGISTVVLRVVAVPELLLLSLGRQCPPPTPTLTHPPRSLYQTAKCCSSPSAPHGGDFWHLQTLGFLL